MRAFPASEVIRNVRRYAQKKRTDSRHLESILFYIEADITNALIHYRIRIELIYFFTASRKSCAKFNCSCASSFDTIK